MRSQLLAILKNSETKVQEKFFDDAIDLKKYKMADEYIELLKDDFEKYDKYRSIISTLMGDNNDNN